MMSMRNPNHFDMPHPRQRSSDRIFSVHMVGQFDMRNNYRDRLDLFQSKGYIPSPYICTTRQNNTLHKNFKVCSSDVAFRDRCLVPSVSRLQAQRAQEQSNYTLCLRGDTLGSDRWINAMTAGTALIQVADNIQEALSWLPFPAAVPWQDLVITIPRKSFHQDPAGAIRHVLNSTTESQLLNLQKLSLHHAADLDWTAHHSRVLENLLYEVLHTACQ